MGMFLAIVCCFSTVAVILPERVDAGEFDNAYTFYQSYKNEMAFQPGANKEGEIYYATKGKKAVSSGTQYTTIGWKVTMTNSSGKEIATLYYQLGGEHMTTVDTQLVDGYEYTLYKVTLTNMRNRISLAANEALKIANCSIVFDACLALKINGVMQGGMTDDGPSWGTVYTTYRGIAGAANWSESTKETLKTYYNKSVEDIYYTVTLSKGTGVNEVTGSGRYCFGTLVTVVADVDEKYSFQSWKGSSTSTNQSYTFSITSNVHLTANATKRNLRVNFYKESSGKNYPDAYRIYYHNTSGQKLPDFSWKKEGQHQIGWSLYKDATNAMYQLTNVVAQSWIDEHIPSVNLYAVWEENSYHITYDANEGVGEIESVTAFYTEEVSLEENGFEREGYCICGWSTKKGATEAEYAKGEIVSVSELVKRQNLEFTNEGTVILYAVWDHAPIIDANVLYVSLEDAQNGKIDIDWLARNARATDKEDGEIPFGENENNSFVLTNYALTDFTSFQKEGAVMQTFCAVDSSGNITKKDIWVYIVDSTIYDAELIFGAPRFISKNYFKDAQGNLIADELGGLLENSIWRMDDSYLSLLEKILN